MAYQVDNELQKEFMDLKLRRTYRMLVIKIEEEQIMIEDRVERGASVEECFNSFPEHDSRYVVWDLPEPGTQHSTLWFITWCPDSIPTERGMIYMDQRKTITKIFAGAQHLDVKNMEDLRKGLGTAPPKKSDADEDSDWLEEF